MLKRLLLATVCFLAILWCAPFSAAAADINAPYPVSDEYSVPARQFVKKLLAERRVVYWYTDATDADLQLLEADGTLDAATLIEAPALSPDVRAMLRARGIVPVARVELHPDASQSQIIELLDAPLSSGWDAVAMDEFLTEMNYAALVPALKKIHAKYPEAALIGWVQPGAPVADLAPVLDLLLIEFANENGTSPYVRESHAPALARHLDALLGGIKEMGPGAAHALNKSVMGLCVCDAFNDAATAHDAFLCDNRSGVDFHRHLDAAMQLLMSRPETSRGAALFSRSRARPETVRVVNRLARHYFRDHRTGYLFSQGAVSGALRNGDFDKDSDVWTFEGSGAAPEEYSKSRLPAQLRQGHGLTAADEAEVSHGARGLRMNGTPTSCNSASQQLTLQGGATYEASVMVAGLKGAERASIWVQDTETGGEHFRAQAPVSGVRANAWSRVSLLFTLPRDTTAVTFGISDCDMMKDQETWWDFAQVEKVRDASEVPAILSAAPVFNSVQGYGFRIQWTPFLYENVSYSQLQYSLDGLTWDNITTEFEGIYVFDWLPQGMTTLPFETMPPGQAMFFRVKILFWRDLETEWSEPYAVVMPRYEFSRTALLNFAAPVPEGVSFSWLPPQEKPQVYILEMLADLQGRWEPVAEIHADAVSFLYRKSAHADPHALFRIKAKYDNKVTISNIAPLAQ